MKNPKYRLPGNSEPFQTTIIVNGGAVFVKLLNSRKTTRDIDFVAAYTDALLEDNGLEDPIVLICQISAIGMGWGQHYSADWGKPWSRSVTTKSESFHSIGQFAE